MSHNFTIVLFGALEEPALLGEATGAQLDAAQRHFVLMSDKIVLNSLLQQGASQTLAFNLPATLGVYRYLCAYPGP